MSRDLYLSRKAHGGVCVECDADLVVHVHGKAPNCISDGSVYCSNGECAASKAPVKLTNEISMGRP